MATSEILLSSLSVNKISDYYSFIQKNGTKEAGKYFLAQLEQSNIPTSEMSLEVFTQLLIQSKIPKVFAESGVYHDKRDWTLQEESILGDISVHMPVTFFNDGGHYQSYKNHDTPILANLAYVPGALLRSDLGGITSDLQEVIVDGEFNQQLFNELYERRLLPQLLQINSQAKEDGKLAAITIPGIGTGQFAGNYMPLIKNAFRLALENVLENHQEQLLNIDIVHYDPYDGDNHQTKKIGHLDYRVCPSSIMSTTAQLAYPNGSNPDTHTLTSFVAWDHFSWPGNDFWPGQRATDDGVKAASSNTMEVITGIKGQYQPQTGSYLPPKGNSNWQDLSNKHGISFIAPIFVVYPDGRKISIADATISESPIDEQYRYLERSSSEENNKNVNKVSDETSFIPSIHILSGFIAALGIAAIAISLTVFSLGIIPASTATIICGAGIATTLTGIGIFKYNALPDSDTTYASTTSEETPLSF